MTDVARNDVVIAREIAHRPCRCDVIVGLSSSELAPSQRCATERWQVCRFILSNLDSVADSEAFFLLLTSMLCMLIWNVMTQTNFSFLRILHVAVQ